LGGLSCTLELPLGWSLLAVGEGGYSQSTEQKNFNRLQVILGLDESPRELHEEESGVAAEIQRLDFKINILLEMVSHLVTVGKSSPEPLSFTLSSQLLLWDSCKEVPPQGARVAVDLFLDPRFPFPLVLQGRVDAVERVTPSSCKVRVVLDPCSESLQEMLEKYIFRCHRRHIARLKKSAV
jgi:hypothetical protein